MDWKHWLKWRPWKRRMAEAEAATPAVPPDEHAALRELLFADEPLEGVARFVREQEALGGGGRSPYTEVDKACAVGVTFYRLMADEYPAPQVARVELGDGLETLCHGVPWILGLSGSQESSVPGGLHVTHAAAPAAAGAGRRPGRGA